MIGYAESYCLINGENSMCSFCVMSFHNHYVFEIHQCSYYSSSAELYFIAWKYHNLYSECITEQYLGCFLALAKTYTAL
jgi:hypothetical protein